MRDSSAELTSKYGFSVVAPISVSEPLLDRRQQRVLLGLVEAVDLVEEEDRARAASRRAARARGRSPRARSRPSPRRPTAPRTRRRSWRRRSARASSCRCPAARRGSSDGRGPPRSRAAAPALADHVLLADELVERRAAAAAARAARPRPPLRGRVGEEVAHARKYARGRGRGLPPATRRRAPAGADPPRHRQPARQRDARPPSSCAATSSRTASSASSTRACPSGRTSSRGSRRRRRPVALPALAHRHRARRRRPSGSATRGRAISSTARSGAAARST